MNGNKLQFDSNTIIYLSKGVLDARKISQPDDIPHISVITYMEVMGYRFNKTKEKRFIKNLCDNAYIIHLNDDIINKVIELRQKHKIKLPDAIIAATALENDLELITRNTDDFRGIAGLKFFNPFEKNNYISLMRIIVFFFIFLPRHKHNIETIPPGTKNY